MAGHWLASRDTSYTCSAREVRIAEAPGCLDGHRAFSAVLSYPSTQMPLGYMDAPEGGQGLRVLVEPSLRSGEPYQAVRLLLAGELDYSLTSSTVVTPSRAWTRLTTCTLQCGMPLPYVVLGSTGRLRRCPALLSIPLSIGPSRASFSALDQDSNLGSGAEPV